MTVKQLKSELEKYPDNMDVFVAPRKTEFTYGLVNSVRKNRIYFLEDENDSTDNAPEEDVIVIDEE